MNLDDHKEFYLRSLQAWGATAQADILQEECAELIQALSKWKRKKMDNGQLSEADVEELILKNQNVREELADVLLMAGEFAFLMGFESVEKIIAEKKARTLALLERKEPA